MESNKIKESDYMAQVESYYNAKRITLPELQSIVTGGDVKTKVAWCIKEWVKNGLLSIDRLNGLVVQLEEMAVNYE